MPIAMLVCMLLQNALILGNICMARALDNIRDCAD